MRMKNDGIGKMREIAVVLTLYSFIILYSYFLLGFEKTCIHVGIPIIAVFLSFLAIFVLSKFYEWVGLK